jgi:hypothetical protein
MIMVRPKKGNLSVEYIKFGNKQLEFKEESIKIQKKKVQL